MTGYQWVIFMADLNPVRGSEQSGTRPVLIVSSEEVNQALPVVTVLPVTTMKPGRKIYPVEVLLKSDETGLLSDSIAMAHQIRVISKERLRQACGAVQSEKLKDNIRNAMRINLDF